MTQPLFDTEGMEVDRGKLVDEAWLSQHQPYLRYHPAEDGVSERAIPGQAGGRHVATSYTHGEDGFYSSGHKEYQHHGYDIGVACTFGGSLQLFFERLSSVLEKGNE